MSVAMVYDFEHIYAGAVIELVKVIEDEQVCVFGVVDDDDLF